MIIHLHMYVCNIYVQVFMYIYICMYVCIYVCMYVRRQVNLYNQSINRCIYNVSPAITYH